MEYRKIIEFNEYVKKYERINKSFDEQLEAEIISIDEVREKRKNMTKKLEKLVLEIHPYAFKQMTGKDTRWYTSIKKEGEERKIIKKNSYEELIDFLIDYYKVKESKKVITLRTMYPIWRTHKKHCTKKSTTIKRIDTDWKTYYANDPIIDVPLEEMTKNQITEWLNMRIIADGVTKRKAFYNLITIFKNVFAYCYEEGLIKENTYLRATYRKDLLEGYEKPCDESQVFLESEEDILIELAMHHFMENTRCTAYLAIPFLFQTGLRCGELVVLETTDYDKENRVLHVSKSETREYEETSDGEIKYKEMFVGDPKKMASVRDITLTETACTILDIIIEANKRNGQSDGNFIFVYNNKRIQTNTILDKLYQLCDEAGIARRSTHKIRKTTLSKLLDICLKEDIADISAIRELAGHVDESTLLKNYIFSRRKDEMPQLIERALVSKSWKHLETFSTEFKKAGSL